ncbi:aspartate aminotransferase family protein [Heyndrickxia sporothermodurans]|uniref:Acetylornithine aminotransferase n=1 Tax=Heyndrickxia sporothermodurans TaxID=46224 RepID=A0AB37HCF4_9BACI|nr:acetylornithine transaminase [Heyndrickxia sporothermodurans]MBL5771333.1 acetylornithine transaminase [Heyndrickxia sporothermodurans]MBL5775048.1 acetylornithine transaminase [Heyndrickxia sporothermodurans]MBL5792472.1 acetylornithine transaminase [Heyndrickxia sporothermodurans]MBL5796376.1 acetylornithine transaminase [Heyndrickxia sporothermodurans]MBL5807340.1 acetylornithine transaminase [Heyndrickxia sporothermodurans]
MLNGILDPAITPVMNTYQRAPIHLQKGKGSYVWDMEGNKYLDFTSGIATCNLGHVPDTVKKALEEQLDMLWHCSNLYHIQVQEKLASFLTEISCMDQAFFCNSGAEANEAAIKLARIYANNVKGNVSPVIVTFKQSFHGRTLATLSATGQEKVQKGFAPLMPGFQYLIYNDVKDLEKIETITPIAVMLELVQGEGGVIPAKKEWIEKLVTICKKNNILLIVDEVQTGMGRTGTMFAYEQYDFEPDIVTLAKGLGSGFPIGAMLAKNPIAKSFVPGTHGSTFGGNPLAAAAGMATVQFLTSNIISKKNEMITYLWDGLNYLKKAHPTIKSIQGKGLLIGIVVDRDANQIVEAARKEGVLILTAGRNVVRLLPPLTVTVEEIDQFLYSFNKILYEMEG